MVALTFCMFNMQNNQSSFETSVKIGSTLKSASALSILTIRRSRERGYKKEEPPLKYIIVYFEAT